MAEKQTDQHTETQSIANREQVVRKVTWVGLFVNIFLAGLKFAAGIVGKSQALIADAIHSLTDLTTDAAVIAGSHYWERPPDDDHPYGHKRLETLVAAFIGIMLAAAGVGIGWKAVSTLHQKAVAPPGWIAVLAALASIICKEAIYRWTAQTGRRLKSAALAANAWHHRTDALSSLPVLAAVAGARLFPSWSFLDRVGAVVVSIFIIHASVKIIWPALSELIDAGVPSETRKKIREIAHKNENVQQVHDIRTRYVSTSIQVDLHIVVGGSLSVRQGHDIADDVRDRIIAEIPEILGVIVHVDPPEKARPEADLL
ncbi:MAG: cation diffusion facilitator family transporter [Desulfobacterales bacterium]